MKKVFILAIIVIGIILWEHDEITPKNDSETSSGNQKKNSPQSSTFKTELLDDKEETDATHWYKEGNLDKAIELLSKELKNPEQKEHTERNLAYLAKSYEYLGKKTQAFSHWNQLKSQFPQSKYIGEAIYFEAEQAKEKGMVVSQMKLLEKAAQYGDNTPGARKANLELGMYYLEKGSKHNLDAWVYLTKAIRSDFDTATKEKIKSKLDPLVDKMITVTPQKVPGYTSYIVQSGDSLWKVAKSKFKTPIGFVKWINQKKKDSLRPREELKIILGKIKIEVSKSKFFLVAYLDGEQKLYLRGYKIGLGKHEKTPLGRFVIETKKEKPDWWQPGGKVPFGDPRNPLGTRWMGFKNTPGLSGYGIHGTSQPNSIGKNQSNGCVRMLNENVEELFPIIDRGTEVIIK